MIVQKDSRPTLMPVASPPQNGRWRGKRLRAISRMAPVCESCFLGNHCGLYSGLAGTRMFNEVCGWHELFASFFELGYISRLHGREVVLVNREIHFLVEQ